MKTIVLAMACLAPLAGARPHAQAIANALPPILAQLIGDWTGSGVVMNRPATLTMTWASDLNGAFVHLRFRNEMAATANAPAQVMESRAYYRAPAGSAAPGFGTWVDSRGVILPLALALSENQLTSDWGSDATERGRTIYELLPDGTLEVTDLVRGGDGEYRPFGRATFRRAGR